MNTRKNPLQAFVMSCLVAGWGLVYVGRVKWAVRVAALLYVGVILLGVCGVTTTPIGLYVFGIFIVLVKLGSATAAAMLARKEDSSVDSPSSRFHVLYVVALIIVSLVLLGPLRGPILGFKTYFIPSGSMVPTLSIGDYIVTKTRIDAPQVGDIVVYRYNGTEAVKRVAAVGGDTLSIVDGKVIRNGENMGLFFAPPERVKDRRYLQTPQTVIEKGHVYLLGDNRDSSNDSRFMGQVAVEDIVGKVTGIWFSEDRSRIGTVFH
ncbi:signal peptidase I [Pseudomonas sp. DTU12.3]|uniref:signal peptidase I n=1 Tax=Pseudomonas sp. DTU12.3 TaxID=2073078 RepID=UPI001011470E|nr:signal peptidase I [Pseudomonas sp. DTU12.3]QAX85983.1 signal peptidase I [Pseudomonas sp. DTU12.3]